MPSPLIGNEIIIHGLLKFSCKKCEQTIRVIENEEHNCGYKTPTVRKSNLPFQRRSSRIRKDLSEIIIAVEKYATEKGEKLTNVGANLLLQLTIIERNKELRKKMRHLIKNIDSKFEGIQISPIEAAALKKGVGLSKSEWENMCFFLNYLSKKGDRRKFNIFPNYKFVQREDQKNLPGSVSYTLRSKETNEIIYDHEGQENPRADNLMQQFTDSRFVPEMRKPNMVGCAYPLPNLLANELLSMKEDLQNVMKDKNITTETLLQVITKQNGDGIGDIDGLPRMRSQQVLPTKIYRENLVILQVFVLKDDGTKIILYKHSAPNTMFSPTILTVVCDESDSYSMRICGEYIQHYRNLISRSIMCVGGLNFCFHQWIGLDGKVSVNHVIVQLV